MRLGVVARMMIRVDRSDLPDRAGVTCEHCGSYGGLVLRNGRFVCRRQRICEISRSHSVHWDDLSPAT